MVVPMFVFKRSFYNPYIPPIHPCIICTIKLCLPGFAPAGRPQSRCYAHQAHLLALGFQAAGFRASTVAGLRLRNLPFRVWGMYASRSTFLRHFLRNMCLQTNTTTVGFIWGILRDHARTPTCRKGLGPRF